jgi:hypothetical protein
VNALKPQFSCPAGVSHKTGLYLYLGGLPMAKDYMPELPKQLIYFYKEQLYRELANMFEWKGLPDCVPRDYLEDNLVRHGYVLYYEHEIHGHDVLRAEVLGYNRHGLPTQARTFTPNTVQDNFTVTRNLKRLSDGQTAKEMFDPTKDGVLIMNMWDSRASHGRHMGLIVDHFAERLAMAQQAIDTNMLWANVPYIFQTASEDTTLSIKKMFGDIFSGKPFIITDKSLFNDNKERAGLPTDIPYIADKLMDGHNEIMMKFRQTVGFDTAGVDKAERTNTLEIASNDQHTKTVLQIMLQQRKIAVESINAFFGTSIEVDLYEIEQPQPQGGMDNGAGNGGTGATDNTN